MTPQDVPITAAHSGDPIEHLPPPQAYDSHDDTAGHPWVQVRRYVHVWPGLPPLFTARVQDGAADRDQLPLVTPACQCPDVAGLTMRAARRRACTRHNARSAAGTCPGRFRLDWWA